MITTFRSIFFLIHDSFLAVGHFVPQRLLCNTIWRMARMWPTDIYALYKQLPGHNWVSHRSSTYIPTLMNMTIQTILVLHNFIYINCAWWYHARRQTISEIVKLSSIYNRLLRLMVRNDFEREKPVGLGEDHRSSKLFDWGYRNTKKLYQIKTRTEIEDV